MAQASSAKAAAQTEIPLAKAQNGKQKMKGSFSSWIPLPNNAPAAAPPPTDVPPALRVAQATTPTRERQQTPANVYAPDDAERRWSTANDLFWLAAPTCDRLPAGLYRTYLSETTGFALAKILCDTDDLIDLPDNASSEVLSEIEEFWMLEPEFQKRGFLHKRGVMLWGPPGSGKTATVQQLLNLVIKKHDGIAIFIDRPDFAAGCFQVIRRIEPKRPIIAILEDLDALIERYRESEFLALLDGESQVDNIVFVATTNYPENLDDRLKDRPSRFDIIKHISMPTAVARRTYLLAKEPGLSEGGEIDKWVVASDGFSIAHLRELIILCKCFHRSLADAVHRLETMRNELPSSAKADDGRHRQVGFVRQRDNVRGQ